MRISDMIGKQWEEVVNIVAKEGLAMTPKVIIIDHIQEVTNKTTKSKLEAIETYLKQIRDITKTHNITTIVCSQVNRTSQEERNAKPELHHLKGSGYIEESADIVWLLFWPYLYRKNKDDKSKINDFYVNVAKQRGGPTGEVKINYDPQYYAFSEPKKELIKSIKEAKIEWQD